MHTCSKGQGKPKSTSKGHIAPMEAPLRDLPQLGTCPGRIRIPMASIARVILRAFGNAPPPLPSTPALSHLSPHSPHSPHVPYTGLQSPQLRGRRREVQRAAAHRAHPQQHGQSLRTSSARHSTSLVVLSAEAKGNHFQTSIWANSNISPT